MTVGGEAWKIYIIIASINELLNIRYFKPQIINSGHHVKLIIIDEQDYRLRNRNIKHLQGLEFDFYGPTEREKWFRDRFGGVYEKYLYVIPKGCHAETSFGFLIAWEENADVVIELDDVKILKQYPLDRATP